MGDIVSAHHDYTGDLRAVLVNAFRGRAVDVLLLGLPCCSDQKLVINDYLVICVEVLLGVVALRREEEVDPGWPGHGTRSSAYSGEGAWCSNVYPT